MISCRAVVQLSRVLLPQVLLNLPEEGATAKHLLERYTVDPDDPREELRGEAGLRARPGIIVPQHLLLAPYCGKMMFQHE